MNILITGVAGFIGSHLAEAMLAQGHAVYGLDNLSTGSAANVPHDVVFTVADVADEWPELTDFDVIYHLAASYDDGNAWERDARTNVLGTVNAVRFAQRHGARLVYAQTSLCYGINPPPGPIKTTAPLNPKGSYAVSKTAGEMYIRDSGVPFVSLRLANIYGPRNLSGPAPAFFKRLSEERPVTVVDSRRDFVFVGDAVEVFAAAAMRGQGVYHVASGGDQAVLDVYEAVVAAMGIDAPAPALTPRGPDDAPTLLLCPTRTEQAFMWRARTPLRDGIAKAVAWYQANGVRQTFTHLTMKG